MTSRSESGIRDGKSSSGTSSTWTRSWTLQRIRSSTRMSRAQNSTSSATSGWLSAQMALKHTADGSFLALVLRRRDTRLLSRAFLTSKATSSVSLVAYADGNRH